jgi:hypothetical protein
MQSLQMTSWITFLEDIALHLKVALIAGTRKHMYQTQQSWWKGLNTTNFIWAAF